MMSPSATTSSADQGSVEPWILPTATGTGHPLSVPLPKSSMSISGRFSESEEMWSVPSETSSATGVNSTSKVTTESFTSTTGAASLGTCSRFASPKVSAVSALNAMPRIDNNWVPQFSMVTGVVAVWPMITSPKSIA